MSLFDSMVTQAGERSGLGRDKASALFAAWLSYIENEAGGLAFFLGKLRSAGLGAAVDSWVGGAPHNEPLTVAQVDTALGADAVRRMANRAGVEAGTAGSVLAQIIPQAVDLLTPGGEVPATLPASAKAYLTGAFGTKTDKAALPGTTSCRRT